MDDHATRFRRYVALGDSLTEGMCDPFPGTADAPRPWPADGSRNPWRGWADRLAESLAATPHGEGFDYANLAIRGKLLPQIIDEQVPAAIAMKPDLVSLIGGGNDVLRPGSDVDAVVARLEDGVAALRAEGITVLMATSYDPRQSPLVRRTRGLAGIFAAHVWSVARRHDAYVLDLWGMRSLQDRRMWAEDRIHLTAEGHARVAAQALEVLGIGSDPAWSHWALPLDPAPDRSRQEAWREDALWVRNHVVPWVGRRLRGRSSGDGLPPKRPHPAPVTRPSPEERPEAGPEEASAVDRGRGA
jgi:lysophospholipase L1-like esterase